MEKVWLNEVEAYAGIAAVDAYLGATQKSETQGTSYGGAMCSKISSQGIPSSYGHSQREPTVTPPKDTGD